MKPGKEVLDDEDIKNKWCWAWLEDMEMVSLSGAGARNFDSQARASAKRLVLETLDITLQFVYSSKPVVCWELRPQRM